MTNDDDELIKFWRGFFNGFAISIFLWAVLVIIAVLAFHAMAAASEPVCHPIGSEPPLGFSFCEDDILVNPPIPPRRPE